MQKAIGFFLLPLYTSYLSPVDYGITGLVIPLTNVLSLFFTLALSGAVTRFYYDYESNQNELRQFLGTIITFVALNSIVLGSIIIVFHEVLVAPFVNDVEFYPYIFIGVLTIIVNPIYAMYQSILQIKQEAKSFSINSIINFVTMICFNVLFIVVLEKGATGMLLAYLCTGVIFYVYSIIVLLNKKLIVIKIRLTYLKQALRYSLPLIPHLISGLLATLVASIFLNNDKSTEYLGLFTLGSQFMLIIDTLQMSVNSAYIPWFYELMTIGKTTHDKIINFADFLMRANCMISVTMALFINEFIQIFISSDYLMTWIIIPVMLIAYQIKGVYMFYGNTLFYNKRASKFIFIATIIGNTLSIGLSIILTKPLGIMAPASILIIEKSVTTAIVIYLSRKFEPIEFKLNKMLYYLVVLILSSGIGLVYNYSHPLNQINAMNVIYKIAILALVVTILMRKDFKHLKATLVGLRIK